MVMNLESEFWHNLVLKEEKEVVLAFSLYFIDPLEVREV
jgi:hypothetical protein